MLRGFCIMTAKTNYINNKEFYNELVKWYESGENTKMPDSIARAIIQICENLARSGKFAGYTWKEDMIQDAILVCVKSARNFNPEKTENPFAYFTQVAYNAFRRFLNIEHTRLATIENYKQYLDISFEDEVSSDDYGYITETAKNSDRAYQKHYEIKRKKKAKANDMDSLF